MEQTSTGRRRFFRRAAIATLIGGLAAGAGFKAWAHGGHRGWHGGEGFSEERVERMVKHFGVEVDATPEQKAKLTEIATAAAKELQPLREKAREARKHAMELLAAPAVDRGAIERLRTEQMQAADAASKRLTQALADVAEVLTPEQRKQLAERLQKRRGWRHG
jgi:Spy/CpxP family protein refolding chaperone